MLLPLLTLILNNSTSLFVNFIHRSQITLWRKPSTLSPISFSSCSLRASSEIHWQHFKLSGFIILTEYCTSDDIVGGSELLTMLTLEARVEFNYLQQNLGSCQQHKTLNIVHHNTNTWTYPNSNRISWSSILYAYLGTSTYWDKKSFDRSLEEFCTIRKPKVRRSNSLCMCRTNIWRFFQTERKFAVHSVP